jgi:hypothetical protein
MSEPFYMWTVYRHPADFPNHYVARLWLVGEGPEPIALPDLRADMTLDGVRALLPLGLTCFQRHPQDDPAIVETWF